MTSSFAWARAAWFFIFVFGATAASLEAQPGEEISPPLPVWLTGRSELLPPITNAELKAMEQAWPKLQVSDVMGNEPPEYWTALQTVVDLGEVSSSALVWLYAKDSPRLNSSAGIGKSYFIRAALSRDSISGRWVLPLLRYRLQWMDGLLAQGEQGPLEEFIGELGAIQGYMNTRGDPRDFQMVMDFINKLAASNDTFKRRLSMFLEPQYDSQARANDEWRKRNRPQPYAYHEMAKLTLTARGGDLTKAAKLLAGQIDSLAWAFPQASLANAVPSKDTDSMQVIPNHSGSASTVEKARNTIGNERTSSTSLLVVAVLIVAVTGLLRWWLKKRK